MKKYICDLCGREIINWRFDLYKLTVTRPEISSFGGCYFDDGVEIHLCEQCTNKFEKMLGGTNE